MLQVVIILNMATRQEYIKEVKTVRTLRRRLLVHPRSKSLKKSLARHILIRDTIKAQLHPPLRLRALRWAQSQVGVMETGPNNAGVPFQRYEKTNHAPGYEPWCGDFMAWVYRRAGSKRVSRAWAAVALVRGLLGIRAVKHPKPGDLVRFTFDHIGMFVKDNGNGTITTIEGNTGPSGAVSDSRTGGDGVYKKIRSKALVRDYLRVMG